MVETNINYNSIYYLPQGLKCLQKLKNSFFMLGSDVFATFQNSLPAGAKYEFTLSCLCCKTAPVKDLQLCKVALDAVESSQVSLSLA